MTAGRAIAFGLVSGGLGGGQRIALAVARELVTRGFSISVLSPSPGESVERFRELGATIYISGPLRSYDLTRMWRLCRFLCREGVSCVYTHSVPAHEIVFGVAALSARSRLVVHRHILGHLSSSSLVHRYQLLMWRFVLRRADAVICVSSQVREQLDQLETDSYLVPNGVPVPAGQESPRDKGEIQVGFIGRMDPNKRLEDFIAAARDIRDEVQTVRFVVVGGGEGTEYENECLRLVEQLGLTSHFSFLREARDAREVMAELDILVLPSILEGHPLVLLEAMANSKAVVATDIPGNRETITDRVHGRLVPTRAPEEIAAAVIELARSPELREEWGRAARAKVKERFTEERMVDELVRIVIGEG